MKCYAITTKGIRCKNKATTDAYCKMHSKKRKKMPVALIQYAFREYLNRKLDEDHDDMLHLSALDSWKEVPPIYKFKMILQDDKTYEWWDLRSLISHVTSQLNCTNYELPQPKYPTSPFTRKYYDHESLNRMNMHVQKYVINIPPVLECFLNHGLKKYTYKELATVLHSFLRFRISKNQDSMGSFTGEWVKKNTEYNDFENLHHISQYIPPEMNIERNIIVNPIFRWFRNYMMNVT